MISMEDFDALVIEMKLDDGEELNEDEIKYSNVFNGLL